MFILFIYQSKVNFDYLLISAYLTLNYCKGVELRERQKNSKSKFLPIF